MKNFKSRPINAKKGEIYILIKKIVNLLNKQLG